MVTVGQQFRINLGWLIKLRWFAVFGQLVTIAFVILLLQIELPYPSALLIVLGLTAASNMMLALWLRGQEQIATADPVYLDLVPGIVMIMDIFSLTALLFATGGPNNPFVIFFVVNISLSATLLRKTWSWSLTGLATICFLFLVFQHVTIARLTVSPDLHPVWETGQVSLMQAGLVISFVLCCGVITYFVTRITAELREQQAGLRHAQQQQARSEKLEALGTLAAGTAHELATPLSTIAVVARDVEKFFQDNPPEDPDAKEVVEDIHLIRSQLDRCRSILNRMASQSGQAVGESIQTLSVADLWDLVLEDLSPEVEENELVQSDIPADIMDEQLTVPAIILSQALRGLVQNALDAGGPHSIVKVKIRGFASHWFWQITDQGPGIHPEVLRRISEPFFSTKPVGKGMGLGVFLARNVIERLEGTIDFSSTVGEGTQVVVRLPRKENTSKPGDQ